MKNDYLSAIALLAAGILIGGIFFGGLWFTVKKSMGSRTPALWFIGSFILRTAIVLVGFYYLSRGHWKSLLICLLGFILARFLTRYLLRVDRPTFITNKKGGEYEN